jgi:salicylate hydroxylase
VAAGGFQHAPTATGVLAELGLLDRVMLAALTPEQVRIRRASDGVELAHFPLGVIAEARWGAPSAVIHRADLQAVLLERCAADPTISLETGATVAGFAESAKGVEVAIRQEGGGRRLMADLLIGADGLRSTIRAGLGLGLGDEPVWSGRTAWRALVPADRAPKSALKLETSLWLGPKAHLVHYPLRRGELINIVAITQDGWRGEEAADLWAISGKPTDVSPRFRSWHRDARSLVAAASEWKRWPLFDRQPVRRWRLDRVALLGDAAHPMLPFFAQGAAQAIEDAGALGRAFTATTDITQALADYERARMARAAAVVIASRRQGAIYHMSGLMGFTRDLTMRSLSPHLMMKRLDWLYDYKVRK